jgi:hypothetical protein
MDRKQQLEQSGLAIRQAWQGRMTSLGMLPYSSESALADVLPAYRGFVGELARFHSICEGAVNAWTHVLDPGLPWHWCGMGGNGDSPVTTPSPQDRFETAAGGKLPPITLPKQDAQAHPSFDSGTVSERKPMPKVDLPPKAQPKVGPQGEDQSSIERKATVNPAIFAERETEDNEASAFEEVTPRQITFKRLDEFAGFIHQASPTQFNSEAGQEKEHRPTLKEAKEPFGADELPTEQGNLQSRKLPNEDARPNAESVQTAVEHSPQLQSQASLPRTASNAQFPQNEAQPFPLAKEGHPLEASAPLSIPLQKRQHPAAEKSSPRSHPDWLQHAQQLAQMVNPTALLSQPVLAAQSQAASPPVLRKSPVPAVQSRISQEAQTAAARNAQSPSVRPMEAPSMPMPSAQPEVAGLGNWPNAEPAPVVNFDDTQAVEQLLDALTEQLQRDFKRIYGA